MIVKSYVMVGDTLRLVTLLGDDGQKIIETETKVEKPIKTLDVESFKDGVLVLKTDKGDVVTVNDSYRKSESAKVEEPVVEVVVEAKEEKKPAPAPKKTVKKGK